MRRFFFVLVAAFLGASPVAAQVVPAASHEAPAVLVVILHSYDSSVDWSHDISEGLFLELRGAGMKPDGPPWWVTLEGVPGLDATPTVAALHGLSIATSGDYRRYFDHGSARASHTLDPRSGYPIANDVASCTVLHPRCMAADAFSTAITVLAY